jgi:hypothetical protein
MARILGSLDLQFVDIAATAGEITPLKGRSTTLSEIGET